MPISITFGRSPYLKKGRLGDVLAALQAMALGERPEGEIKKWAEALSNTALVQDEERWTAVFQEHPEFFLVYTIPGQTQKKAVLRWRYTNRKYDSDTGKLFTQEEKAALPQDKKHRLTTEPLDHDAVGTLLNTAIELHARAVAEEATRIWWVPLLTALLGFAGALAGAYIAHK